MGELRLHAGAAFYFDLASPDCYLVAERILHELGVAAEWRAVLARELPDATARERTMGTAEQRARIERCALELELQPLRWPEPFPFDSELAMRAASYAQQIGRAVAFAQAAFRQAFAGGRSLAQADNVLIAGAACEMHPAAVLRALELRSVAEQLRSTTARAAGEGVRELPAIVLPAPAATTDGQARRVLQGPGALAQARTLLAEAGAP